MNTHLHRVRLHAAVRSKQQGLSLLELLVGITIGLMVSVAAVGSLVFTRVSSTMVNDTVLLQQDAGIVMRTIGRQLKQAGAIPIQDAVVPAKFEYLRAYVGLNNLTPMQVSINGTNGVADTLAVSYSVAPTITQTVSDCFGDSPVAGETDVVSTFRLVPTREFQCRGRVPTFQAIASNVDDFQVWYAVRNGPNLQYFTADLVAAAGGWTQVEAVQICLRLSGTSQGNPTLPGNFLGCNNENIANDGRIRRVFRQVFSLRNLQAL